MPKLGILSTHPIQYYSPWFRYLASEADRLRLRLRLRDEPANDFQFEVFYAHEQTAKGQAEAGFGVEFEWDVPLLEGYPYRFLKNMSKRPGLDWFGGCDCPKIGEILVNEGFTHVLLIGWHKKVFWQAFWAAKKAGIKVLSRGDSQLGMTRSPLKRAVKYLLYRILLPRFDAHLYVGRRNREYLRHYGVKDTRLFFSPHFVDNNWWSSRAKAADEIKIKMKIKESGVASCGSQVAGSDEAESGKRKAEKSVKFLFAGKFIPKKRVMDLLDAAAQVPEARVVLVGDGPLKEQLKARASQNDLMEEADHSPFAERVRPLKPAPAHSGDPVPGKADSLREGIGRSQQGEYCHREGNMISRVLFAGFRNQGELPAYLAAADCLVLPSDGTETWGLIVNEAMACGTPAIVSQSCGCVPDLIEEGKTGFSFPMGNTEALSKSMRLFMERGKQSFQNAVSERIRAYSMNEATCGLQKALEVS